MIPSSWLIKCGGGGLVLFMFNAKIRDISFVRSQLIISIKKERVEARQIGGCRLGPLGQIFTNFYLHLKPTAEDLLLPLFHLQVFKLLPSPLDLLPLRIGLRSKWTVRAWSRRGGKSHRAPQRPSGQPRAVAPVYQAGSLFRRLGGKHLRVQYSVGKRVQTCRGKMEPILAILPK